jgi:hypothetical protein
MKIKLENILCSGCHKRPSFVPVLSEIMWAVKERKGIKSFNFNDGALCKKCYKKYRRNIEIEYKKYLSLFLVGIPRKRLVSQKKNTKKSLLKKN